MKFDNLNLNEKEYNSIEELRDARKSDEDHKIKFAYFVDDIKKLEDSKAKED